MGKKIVVVQFRGQEDEYFENAVDLAKRLNKKGVAQHKTSRVLEFVDKRFRSAKKLDKGTDLATPVFGIKKDDGKEV